PTTIIAASTRIKISEENPLCIKYACISNLPTDNPWDLLRQRPSISIAHIPGFHLLRKAHRRESEALSPLTVWSSGPLLKVHKEPFEHCSTRDFCRDTKADYSRRSQRYTGRLLEEVAHFRTDIRHPYQERTRTTSQYEML